MHAAEAMGLLRGIVGFLTFLLAFDLKGGGNDAPVHVGLAVGRAARHIAGFPTVGTGHPTTAPEWHFGAVLVASVAGALLIHHQHHDRPLFQSALARLQRRREATGMSREEVARQIVHDVRAASPAAAPHDPQLTTRGT